MARSPKTFQVTIRNSGQTIACATDRTILQAAIAYRLLCIGICDTADLAQSPQLAARGYFGTTGTGNRERTMPAQWAGGSVQVTELRRPAPLLGEHTDEVCADWLAAERSSAEVAEVAGVAGDLPLAGLKVADFSWVVAGPVVGRALAAEDFRVEFDLP